jgi:P pilus assembly chaperone PapD
MKNILLMPVICIALAIALISTASASVVLGGTRLIYPEAKKEVSLPLNNTSKKTDFLIQSWAESADGEKAPFVVTPPLFRLDHEKRSQLRVTYTGKPLAEDKETLFYMSVKAIPGIDKNKSGNMLQIALNQKIKLIYRPQVLKDSEANDAYKNLKFYRQDGSLIVKNPTPFFISFYELKAGGKEIAEAGMVAPRGETRFKNAASGKIEWRAINDFGGATPPMTQ